MNLLLGSALHALSRRRFAAIVFGVGTFVLAACESANTGSGINPSSLGVLPKGLVRQASVTSCPHCYEYFPVGPFFGENNTWITGLSNDPKKNKVPSCTPVIVGVSFNNVNQSYTGFDSVPHNNTCTDTNVGSYTTPNPLPPNPYNVGTYLSSVLVSTYAVGFAPSTTALPCNGGTICGLIYNPKTSGRPSVVQAPGSCGKTYLYGTSDTAIQVGYYTKSSNHCLSQAVEEYTVSTSPNNPPACTSPPFPASSCTAPQFADLQVPSSFGTSPIAYGINTKGDVVGTYATTSGTFSWEYSDLQYSMLPTWDSTSSNWQALGINFANDVVGSYVNASGTHGFEQTTTPSQAFEIDYPEGLGTVVNSINDDQEIAGHYGTTVANIANGFVAFCKQLPSSKMVQCPGNTGSGARRRSTLADGGSAARPQR